MPDNDDSTREDYDRISRKIMRDDPDIAHDLMVVKTYIKMSAEALEKLEEKLKSMFEGMA